MTPVTLTLCETCRQPTSSSHTPCALCGCPLCEDCILSPPTGTFSLLDEIPKNLAHTQYCRFCFTDQVEPEIVKYEETLEKAKSIYIFFTTQRKEIPLIRKSKEIYKIDACEDRDETILRLAYKAAAAGFNAVVNTEVLHEKKRNHAYQKTIWRGTGSPAMIDESKLDRQYKQDQMYR